MDKTLLVEPDVEAGKDLLSALERAGLAISIAAWLKLEGSVDWNLFIASPDVQKYGPRTINKFIDKVRVAIKSDLSMDNITATNTTNHFINKVPPYVFISGVNLRHAGIYRIRNLNIAEVVITDGVIYKVDRSVGPSKSEPRPNAEALKKAKLAA